MNTETTAAHETDDPSIGVPVEVHFVVEDGAGSLVLAAVGADALEIPLSRQDCINLAQVSGDQPGDGVAALDPRVRRACGAWASGGDLPNAAGRPRARGVPRRRSAPLSPPLQHARRHRPRARSAAPGVSPDNPHPRPPLRRRARKGGPGVRRSRTSLRPRRRHPAAARRRRRRRGRAVRLGRTPRPSGPRRRSAPSGVR
jgi:hypothetical protein